MPEYSLCRICLTEDLDSDTMQPLFDDNDSDCSELVRKIEECGGIRLRPLEEIPSMLCYRCLEALNAAYKFRELCQASENAFIESMVKTEVKSELVDGTSQDGNDDMLIFDMRAEYIDGEEIEMTDIAEASGEDVLDEEEVFDEEHIQFVDGDADMDDSDYKYLGSTSDSDYEPIEKAKTKPKIRKTKQSKRGRPRLIQNISKDRESSSEKQPRNRNNVRRSEEDNPTSIMCEICGNIYTKRGALNMHMRRHMAEKPFACEICGKTFAGPSELNRHIRVHTGEKPFLCKFCNRSFADRSSNIRHERTHTNERPFSCSTCGKAFAYSNVLKNHMLTHTGEKPFLCVPCNKTFSRKHQLDQHIATITHQATVKTRAVCSANGGMTIECVDE